MDLIDSIERLIAKIERWLEPWKEKERALRGPARDARHDVYRRFRNR